MSIAERNSSERIFLIAEALDPERGGQERSIREYIAHLEDRGWRVEVFEATAVERLGSRRQRLETFLDAAEDYASAHRSQGIVQAMVPVRAAHLYLPRGGLYAEAYLRSAESHTSPAARAFAKAGLNWSRRRRLLLARERELLSDGAGPRLLALSSYVADQAARHFGLTAPRVVVVRNGVETRGLNPDAAVRRRLRADLGVASEEVLVLALAHNFRLKGIPELVAAVSDLDASLPLKLVIAGQGEGISKPPRVRFLGPRSDAKDLLQACDALAHPTYYDPMSRVVLEALALQKPVLTTRWNGAADFVGDAGIVLETPRDSRALQAAILRLLDSGFRAQCALAAAPLREQVSMSRHADEMIRLIREIAP